MPFIPGTFGSLSYNWIAQLAGSMSLPTANITAVAYNAFQFFNPFATLAGATNQDISIDPSVPPFVSNAGNHRFFYGQFNIGFGFVVGQVNDFAEISFLVHDKNGVMQARQAWDSPRGLAAGAFVSGVITPTAEMLAAGIETQINKAAPGAASTLNIWIQFSGLSITCF